MHRPKHSNLLGVGRFHLDNGNGAEKHDEEEEDKGRGVVDGVGREERDDEDDGERRKDEEPDAPGEERHDEGHDGQQGPDEGVSWIKVEDDKGDSCFSPGQLHTQGVQTNL